MQALPIAIIILLATVIGGSASAAALTHVSGLLYTQGAALVSGQQDVLVNKYNMCRWLDNNGSNEYLVPYNIEAEWQMFVANAPSDVSQDSCCPARNVDLVATDGQTTTISLPIGRDNSASSYSVYDASHEFTQDADGDEWQETVSERYICENGAWVGQGATRTGGPDDDGEDKDDDDDCVGDDCDTDVCVGAGCDGFTDPTPYCFLHADGGFLSDKTTVEQLGTNAVNAMVAIGEDVGFAYRGAFYRTSDVVGAGTSPDAAKFFPYAIAQTFDSVAIGTGTRVKIWSGKNYTGDVVLDIQGPAVIYNVIWKEWSAAYQGAAGYTPAMVSLIAPAIEEAKTKLFQGSLPNTSVTKNEMFPPAKRVWSDMNMHEWGKGSVEVSCR